MIWYEIPRRFPWEVGRYRSICFDDHLFRRVILLLDNPPQQAETGIEDIGFVFLIVI